VPLSDGHGSPASAVELGLTELTERARRLCTPGRRAILGIAGAPGAGKSTLAAALAQELRADVVVIGMDGFHLAHAELVRLGLDERKGAPETFDAHGYVALLSRVHANAEPAVYAPAFRRDLEEPIAGAVRIGREIPLVITEGNYLLLDQDPWSALRGLLDEVWYLEVPEQLRIERLVARHVTYGKTADDAHRWANGSDQGNATMVAASRPRADLAVRLTDRSPQGDNRTTPGARRSAAVRRAD
jgi:pantothenate kinase